MSKCRFCNQEKKLVYSHAIPNAFFKTITRNNNGKAIGIPKGDRKIHQTSDSGKDLLLCEDCEKFFNTEYDAFFVNLLKELDKKIINEGFSSRVPVDTNHFTKCIASIFWRACVSKAFQYSEVLVSPNIIEQLSNIMESKKPLKFASVKFERMFDKTPLEKGGLSLENIAENWYNVHVKEDNNITKFKMGMQGFLIRLFIPKLPHKERMLPSYLKANSKLLHAPPLNIFDYPSIIDGLVRAIKKDQEGHVSSSLKKKRKIIQKNPS